MLISSELQTKESIRFYVLFLCLYYIFSPFEYLLTSEEGSLLKYIAVGFSVFSLPYLLQAIKYTRFSDPIIWSPILLIIISYLSVTWTIDIEATNKMNTTYLFLQLMFLIVYIIDFNEREQYFVRKAILIGGVLVSLYVLVFSPEILVYRSEDRMALNEADPNEFAALLTLALFVSFEQIINSKSKWNILLFISLLFMILYTGSRGALIGCGFAFIYFLFFKFEFNFKLIIILLVIGSVLYVLIPSLLPEHIIERLSGGDDIIGTLEFGGGRTEIWYIIFGKIIVDMPFLGYGSGCSSLIIAPYFNKPIGSHNTYFLLLLEYGILGLSIFMYFLWSIYKKIKYNPQFSKVLSFIAILIIVFFLDAYFKKYLWNILMYVVISNKFYVTQQAQSITPDIQSKN